MKSGITKTSWLVGAVGILVLTGFCRPAFGQESEAAKKLRVAIYQNLAETAIADKDYGEAEEHLRLALQTDKSNLKTLTKLAWVCNETRQFDKAIAASLLALIEEEYHADAWRELGYAFLQQKNYERAIRALKRAVKLNPNDKGAVKYLRQAQQAVEE